MRDDRSYRDLNCSWEDFCTTHLKVSRRSVDRVIGRLEEFGPAYFHLAQLTHLRADATIDSHRSNRIVPGWQRRMSFEGETADLLGIG
jgi:hypothetical protein